MQNPRLSTVLVDKIEDLIDTIREAAEDGSICSVEVRNILNGADTVYRFAQVNDLNIANVTAQLRTGPDSQRTRKTRADLRASLTLLEGGRDTKERSDRGNDPSAA